MVVISMRRSFVLAGALALVATFSTPTLADDALEEAVDSALESATSGEGAESQEGSDDQDEAPVAAEGAVLDEIIVTAQKRRENIKDVPLSVSTLDTEALDLIITGAADVRALSGRVPSLLIESSFGRAFPRFYIRGLGNTDFDLNASQPVSLIYDDVVLENPIVKGMPIWDIAQTEVLRGPQGTLFGRNTPAGIVKFESVKPSQELDSFLRLSFGTFNTLDLKGAIGGRLTDTLSARFSGLYQSRGNWVDNEFTGQNDALGDFTNYAWRAQLLWEPNEKFSGLLNLHGWDVDGSARIFRANIIEPGTNNLVSSFRQDRVFQDGLNSQDIQSQGGVLKLEYDLGSSTLTSVTGFETLEMLSRGDIDGGFGAVFAPPSGPGFIPFPSETADGLPNIEQFTQELRIASNPGDRVNWLAGLYYFDESLQADTFSFNSLAGNEQDGYAFQKQDSTSWAAFGNVNVQASDRWKLQAGLRYTEDKRDFAAERPDPTFQTPTVEPIVRNTDVTDLSWDASATYTVNPNVNVYGRVATSFRAPSIQGRILFCPDFEGGTNPETNCVSVADKEKIISTELGIKSELMDRRLRLFLTGYVYEVDGQQLVAVGGEFNTSTLLNADTTNGYGFEADIEIAPVDEWLFKLGLSYNKTEIDDPNLEVGPCGGGCTVLDPVGPKGGVLVDGNSLPHAPEWIFNGIVDYRKPVGNGLIIGTLDWAYYSEKQFFLYESEEFKDDSLELGLRLGYAFSSYELALWSRNITDAEILRNGIDFNNLTGMTNDPRTVGIEFVTKW